MKIRAIALAGAVAVLGLQLVATPARAGASVITIEPATLSASESDGDQAFTLIIDPPPTSTVTVDYATSNGTAAAGSDYTSTSGTASFLADDSFSFDRPTVPILEDATTESSETFTLTLSNPSGGAILGSPSSATITITDNDTQTLAFSSSTATTSEASSPLNLTVNRTGSTSGSVSVSYGTSNGTASAPGDYTSTTGTLTFPNGVATKNLPVPIINDTTAESSETFTVTLSSPTGSATLGSPSSATVTITDNDTSSGQTLAFSSATASVGESAGPATLTVTRSGGTTGTATVAYSTAAGTATAGSDYTTASGTLTFAAGETSKTISVTITNDTTTESSETFTITLSSPTGASLGSTSTATVSITDDDGSTAVLGFSASEYSVDEDGTLVTITVTRSGSTSGNKSVDYATGDGTATAGSDYTPASGTLTFAGTDTSKTFDVLISDDSSVEGDETVTVTLSGPTGGAALGTSTATLTVEDDDAVVTHERTVGLRLRRHLRARGTVSVEDGGPSACVSGVRVKIQKRRSSGGWRTVKTKTTNNDGVFRASLPDKRGRYRAKIAALTLESGDICGRDISPTKRHRH